MKGAEVARARQRAVCVELLERWVPLAVSDELVLKKENRGKPVLDEEPVEMGLKVGAFVLKVMERWARLDGLDAAEKVAVTAEVAGPQEVARRIAAVRPLLVQQMEALRRSGRIGEGEEPGMAIASLTSGD